MLYHIDANAPIKVLEESLFVDTSDGSKLSVMSIKFSLDADTLQGTNTDERRATDTFSTMHQAISALSSAPQPVGLLKSALDMAPNFANQMVGDCVRYSVAEV